MKNIILNNTEINYKLKRMAYQIYETFINTNEVVLAGISENGLLLANKVKDELDIISDLQIILCKVTLNKNNVFDEIQISILEKDYKNKGVVIIDDVLHSGTTLIYCVKHFLNTPLLLCKTAVLIDRNHKKFPIKADFKGLSLSTSIQSHVEVVATDDEIIAYLTD